MGSAQKEQRGSDAFRAALGSARAILWQAAVGSCFVNILMLTGPLYMLQVYDRVLASRSTETLVVITVLIFGLYAAMAVLDHARGALLARAGTRFERKLQSSSFDFAMEGARLSPAKAEQPLKDGRQVRQFLASPALVAVFDAPWTPIYLAIVFFMHWVLGLVALIGMIVLVVLALLNERLSHLATLESQRLTVDADRTAAAAFRNHAAVDAMGMRTSILTRWERLSAKSVEQATHASDVTGNISAATKAIRLFLQSAILGVGAYLAIRGEISSGTMIAASIIAGRSLAPVEIVTGQWKSFILAAASFRRLRDLISRVPAHNERTRLPAPRGALTVDRLFCQPGAAKRPVLKGVSFRLEAGEALGVLGPSAAGKSTLGKAIVGVEPIASGDVRLDGARLDQWDRTELGRHIGYLPQDVELFAGTAAENIARFDDGAIHENIIEAAQAAGAHEMILSLADGYNTNIGEDGAHLSGGQRQRLALARALYGNPALVVLDEPNASLDLDGDAALTAAIHRLKARGATVIVIAHRPSAVSAVDKLLVLADGEVKAFGPREEILKKVAPAQIATLKPAASA